MKRTFLKVLPFAAALLLATSCSKDENNSVDEIVNGGEQTETVVKTVKTLTIKGKVNKSISKVTTNDAGTALAFEGNEVFTFGNEGDDVYGTINFTESDGSYTATVNYADEQSLSGNFTASLGTNSSTISSAYDDLATAVQNAYYTINFSIVQENEEYKLKSGETDLVVNLQSAFIEALGAKTTQLGGTEISVEAGKYYIVPVGKVMGESSNSTVAGKIYTIKAPDYLPGVFTIADGKKVKFSKGNLQYHCMSKTWRFAENQWDYIGSANENISSFYDGYIDLFGWGMWLEDGNPVNKSTTYSDYTWDDSKSSAFGSEWTTLTKAEWEYLFNTRTTTSTIRYAMAQVNNVNGVILLPDNWSPETYTLTNTNTSNAAFTTNTIDATNWSTLEAAGAVFLPAAGYRLRESVEGAGSNGYYWSGTARGTSDAYIVYCESGKLYPTDDYGSRFCGFSVRPVRVQN